jgi:hypothetical protein
MTVRKEVNDFDYANVVSFPMNEASIQAFFEVQWN